MACLDDRPRTSGVPAKLFRQSRSSGVVKLSSLGISIFPPELCDPDKYVEEGEKAWQIVLPKHIHLADNDIAVLPDAMSDSNPAFSSLKALDMRNNNLTALPAGIFSLSSIVSLNFSGNERLAHVVDNGAGLGGLKQLKELDLSHTALATIPPSIGGCTALVKLQMTHCPNLKGLPESLCTLHRTLTSLDVSHCGLIALPVGIGKLSSLTSLVAHHCRIGPSLPTSIADLTSLEVLNAGSNRLTDWPRLPHSTRLQRLFLGHNRLVCVIGDELLHVPNLIELLLNNNLIEEIPQEVGALAKLRVLDVRLRIVSFPSYF